MSGISGLFSPKIPKPQSPATMPDTDSPAVQEAARQAQLDALSRAGRRSTILSQGAPQGREYTATRLGSGS